MLLHLVLLMVHLLTLGQPTILGATAAHLCSSEWKAWQETSKGDEAKCKDSHGLYHPNCLTSRCETYSNSTIERRRNKTS